MKKIIRRSCLSLVFLSVLSETIQSNETDRTVLRQGRVSGRIVKLYSGPKPDPFLCDEEGFKADPVDCSIFYRCLKATTGKYTVYKFQCGPGTVFDPENEVCNHPNSSKRSECGALISPIKHDNENEIEEQELPRPMSTKLPVYTPYTGLKEKEITKRTYAPTIFTSTQLENDISSNNTQFTSNIPVTTQRQITAFSNTLQTNQWTDFNSKYTTHSSSQKSNPCIADGFMGDSIDCRKFYRCVSNSHGGFIRYEFLCSEPTVWDDNIQSCNHPWAVRNKRCGRISIDEEHATVTFASLFSTNDLHSNKYNEQPIYGDKMTQTLNEVSNPVTTPKNSEFYYKEKENDKNEIQNIGDSYNKIEKEDKYNEKQTSTSSTTLSMQYYGDFNELNKEYSITNSKTEKAVSTTETLKRSTDCTSSGFIGDVYDCKIFYRCVDSGKGTYTKYQYKCGEGTLWDENIEACNHAWAVKSCNKTVDIQSTIPHTTNINDAEFITTVKIIQTTTQQNGIDDDYDSGYSQQIITTSKPMREEQIISKPPIKQTNECHETGFIGDNNDCKKFYRCVDNGNLGFTRYEFSCGEGTVWDPELEACNHIWAVKKCGNVFDKLQEITTQSIQFTGDGDEFNNGYMTQSPTKAKEVTNSYTTSTTSLSKQPDYLTESVVRPSHVSSSPIANTDNECISTGFFGDNNDCNKFYRCVDNGNGGFIRHEFTCGEGTVWDSEIEACNHKWAVEKCGGYPNVESTNHITGKDDEQTMGYPLGSTEKATSTEQLQALDYKCTTEGFQSDQYDCKKFYRCVNDGRGNFIKYEFYCGDGTIWDQIIQACNHEIYNTSCSKSVSSTTPKSPVETTHSHVSSPSTLTTHSGIPLPVTSREDYQCTTDGFYAHPYDCKKFIRCVDNGKDGWTKFEFSCGDGTIWIQELQACDHNTDMQNCSVSSITESYEDTGYTTVTTTTKKNNEDLVHVIKNDTQSQCSSEGFYPDKNDCRNFYRCVDSGDGIFIKYEFSCAEGTAWDKNIQACNHKSEVKSCQSDTGLHNDSQSKPAIQDEQNLDSVQNTSTTTHSTSTRSTTTPSTSTRSTTTPSTTASSESTTIRSTVTSTQSTITTVQSDNKNICKDEGYFGNKEDCKKFYRCVSDGKDGYTKYDYTCADGTIWDQDIITCNHPYDVKNPSCNTHNSSTTSTTTITPTSSSLQTESSTHSPKTTKSPPGSTTTSTESSTPPQSNSNNCSTENSSKSPTNITCSKAGFYADPNNCKKFYRCVDWDNNGEKFSVYHFECGDGTIWDPVLETCNHEESVYPPRDCSGGQNQNVTDASPTMEQTTSHSEETTASTVNEQTTAQESTTNAPVTTQKSTTHTTEKSTSPQTTKKPTTETSSPETTTESQITEQTTSSSTEQSTSKEETTTKESSTVTTAVTEEMSTTESVDNNTNNMETTMVTTTELTTTENIPEITTQSGSTEKQECPDTDDDQFLYVCPTSFKRHPKYCNLFYQCTEDNDSHELKIAVFHCPNSTIYDESKIQCVEEQKSDQKCKGQIAQRYRVKRLDATFSEPMVVSNENMSCPSAGHFPFEKNEECSPALLKCEYTKSGKLRGYVYRCPEDFVYWSISRRCEAIRKVTDCKRSSYAWNKRYDIPVERRNIS